MVTLREVGVGGACAGGDMSLGGNGRAWKRLAALLGVSAAVVAAGAMAQSRDESTLGVGTTVGCADDPFIVAWASPPRQPDIWAVRLGSEDAAISQLTDGMHSREPAVSPGGDLIAFSAAPEARRDEHAEHGPGSTELWLMEPDGSEQRPLFTHPDWSVESPSWSHDGRFLAVKLSSNAQGDATVPPQAIAVIEVGTGEMTIQHEPGAEREVRDPSWAPDDSEIVFVLHSIGDGWTSKYEVVTTRVRRTGNDMDREELKVLHMHEPPFAESISRPSFSPSESKLAYESSGRVVTIDYRRSTELEAGNGRYPMWRPGRDSLLYITELSEGESWIVEQPEAEAEAIPIVEVHDMPFAGASAQLSCTSN